MIIKYPPTIILATVAVLIITPAVANAQSIIDPNACHGVFDFIGADKARYCTLCDGLNAIKSGINLLLEIGMALAGIIIAYGGIMIMVSGASPGKYEQGKKAIIGSVVGVAIGLMAWIIINQIFFIFVTKNVTTRPWNEIPCKEEPIGFGGLISGGPPGAPPPPGTAPPPGTGGDDAAIRQRLTTAGINIVSSGNCSDQQNRNCTSVLGLPDTAVQKLLALQEVCNCVTITAGTEIEHDSHGPGLPVVDLRNSPEVIAGLKSLGYSETNFDTGYTCESAPGVKTLCNSGNVDHIHVEF